MCFCTSGGYALFHVFLHKAHDRKVVALPNYCVLVNGLDIFLIELS
jgi:hypothetical protein